ncbi:hypothetical protein [Photobacterium rosenbergii]|uniref:hypothetical protein n=1 Tax=Photobacterium rosenbergii TaxID=294936 RepID=UPI001C99544A|nr:hypothetical protein [Photobacterium rosenbergii]MBY5948780.1 hypothetical protein [Photobacterium rosenbergii]
MKEFKKYRFNNLRNKDYVITGQMVAKYEVNFTDWACSYAGELDVNELFDWWVEEARQHYPSGYIDIQWFVSLYDQPFKPEFFPEEDSLPWENDFLDYFSHPVEIETGESVNWASLPVIHPRWDDECKQAGGFIEQVTGWKPTLLQSRVSIDSLVEAADSMKRLVKI